MTEAIAVVTGAGGYLGRALVSRLVADGVGVRAITRSTMLSGSNVTIARVGVADVDALAAQFTGADVVFHLTAHTHDLRSTDDTAMQDAITYGSTVAMLTATERAGVKNVIFVSSLAVFGRVGQGQFDESAPCDPATPYGRAKLRAEHAVTAFAERTGAHATSIRPAMIYGVGCPGNLPRMIRAVARGVFPPIPEFGNRRSMVAVVDVADALVSAWRHGVAGGQEYIITDGNGYSTRQLYDMIRVALGKNGTGPSLPASLYRIAARIGDCVGSVAGRRMPFDTEALDRLQGWAFFSSERARRELGFAPRFTLSDLLPAMIAQLASR